MAKNYQLSMAKLLAIHLPFNGSITLHWSYIRDM